MQKKLIEIRKKTTFDNLRCTVFSDNCVVCFLLLSTNMVYCIYIFFLMVYLLQKYLIPINFEYNSTACNNNKNI